MYKIEVFVDMVWVLASDHTQSTDAQVQLDRFIANGVDPDSLRKVGW